MGVAEAVDIQSTAHMLHPVSRTFHGRDVFAPVAAHLAAGVALGALGAGGSSPATWCAATIPATS